MPGTFDPPPLLRRDAYCRSASACGDFLASRSARLLRMFFNAERGTRHHPPPLIIATPTWPTQCVDGSLSLLVSDSQNPPLCVSVGAHLDLVFQPSGTYMNTWTVPPVSSSVPEVVSVAVTTETGYLLDAQLHVKTPGTTQIQASVAFRECSSSNPSPCDSGAPSTTAPPPPPPLIVNVTVPVSTRT